jgi:hypothetical protein
LFTQILGLAKFAQRADRLNPTGFKRVHRGNPANIDIAISGIIRVFGGNAKNKTITTETQQDGSTAR